MAPYLPELRHCQRVHRTGHRGATAGTHGWSRAGEGTRPGPRGAGADMGRQGPCGNCTSVPPSSAPRPLQARGVPKNEATKALEGPSVSSPIIITTPRWVRRFGESAEVLRAGEKGGPGSTGDPPPLQSPLRKSTTAKETSTRRPSPKQKTHGPGVYPEERQDSPSPQSVWREGSSGRGEEGRGEGGRERRRVKRNQSTKGPRERQEGLLLHLEALAGQGAGCTPAERGARSPRWPLCWQKVGLWVTDSAGRLV